MADFERFRAVVLTDSSLRERLLEETELDPFVELVIALAARRGFAVTGAEVRSAHEAASRSWVQKQVR
jgi:hypothetical protein